MFETQVLDELGQRLTNHIVQLVGRVPTLRGATFVLNVESNMGYVADSLADYVRRHAKNLPRIYVLRQDLRRRYHSSGGATDVEMEYRAGTRTTQRNKKEMVGVFLSLLRGGLVRFSRQLFATGGADKAQQYRDELIRELRNFKRERRPVTVRGRQTSIMREFFTGKTSGTKTDDWTMSTLICTYTFDMVERSNKLKHLID